MSLRIKNLTKVYGQQKAVDNISFEIGEGEIVGFLGPNGAGKSTTMKVAASYIPPTEGTVTVAGFDVVSDPLPLKKVLGYLPEHNPLYLDMFVHEYLRFTGKLYGLRGKALLTRVDSIIERCGLQREQNKKIEALSKGYRQRVGLAQALIHDPKVLILDEPTSGLDPNQIIEIRNVIRDVSYSKTVLFSSHIMQEVEALCQRVILINKGKLVADDSLTHLLAGKKRSAVVVEFEQDVDPAEWRHMEKSGEVVAISTRTFRITAFEERDIRPEIFRFAAERNLSMVGLRQEENSLESIFHDLTR